MNIGDYVRVHLETEARIRVGRIEEIEKYSECAFPYYVRFSASRTCSCSRNELEIMSEAEAMLYMLENV